MNRDALPKGSAVKIQIRVFAGLKERLGGDRVELELPADATVAQARSALAEAYPAAAPLVQRALFATESDYLADTTPVPSTGDLACIPPVSGG